MPTAILPMCDRIRLAAWEALVLPSNSNVSVFDWAASLSTLAGVQSPAIAMIWWLQTDAPVYRQSLSSPPMPKILKIGIQDISASICDADALAA